MDNFENEYLATAKRYHEELRGKDPDYCRYAEFLLGLTTNDLRRLQVDSAFDLQMLFSGLTAEDLETLITNVPMPPEWKDDAKRRLHAKRTQAPPKPRPPIEQNDETLQAMLKQLKNPDPMARALMLGRMMRDELKPWLLDKKDVWEDPVAALLAPEQPKLVSNRAARLFEHFGDDRYIDYWIAGLDSVRIEDRRSAWDHVAPILPPETHYDPKSYGQERADMLNVIRTLRSNMKNTKQPEAKALNEQLR